MSRSRIASLIPSHCQGRFRKSELLAGHTSIKIGGPAEFWFEPEDEPSLSRAVRIAADEGVPILVMGGGSNLLLPDEGIKGLVMHLSFPAFRRIQMDGDDVVVGGAVGLSTLLNFLILHGRGDCEFLMGIPAQVGGAIMMNAGSATQWIGSYLVDLEGIDFKGCWHRMSREEIPFGYRKSGLENLVITKAVLRFPQVLPELTRKRLSEYAAYRRKSQDLSHPSAGCMFRNPAGTEKSAGRIIEEAGLKGRLVGRAQVSRIHANFVINLGGAFQRDVLELLRFVEGTIRERFGIEMIREIKVIKPWGSLKAAHEGLERI